MKKSLKMLPMFAIFIFFCVCFFPTSTAFTATATVGTTLLHIAGRTATATTTRMHLVGDIVLLLLLVYLVVLLLLLL